MRNLLLLTALILVGLNNACSTPTVPYTNPDQQDTAWLAYQNCLSALPAGANTNACNNVGSAGVESNYYNTTGSPSVNGGATTTTTTTYRGAASVATPLVAESATASSDEGVGQETRAQIMKLYIKSVDEKTLLQMTADWRDLADVAAGTR